MVRGVGVGTPARNRQAWPYRGSGILDESRTHPAVLERRVHIGRIRSGAAHAGEAKRAIVGLFDRVGLFAEFENRSVAQSEPCLIKDVEVVKDQQRNRLTQIERRLAEGANQIARIEFGNAHADSCEVVGGHNHGRLQRACQTRKVDSKQTMVCVSRADEHGVGGLRGPAGKIGGAKIARVEFRPGDLDETVDAPGSGGRRIPFLPARQGFTRGEVDCLRISQT